MRLKSLSSSHANKNRPFKWNNGSKSEREGAAKETRATATGEYDGRRVATFLRKRAVNRQLHTASMRARTQSRTKASMRRAREIKYAQSKIRNFAQNLNQKLLSCTLEFMRGSMRTDSLEQKEMKIAL